MENVSEFFRIETIPAREVKLRTGTLQNSKTGQRRSSTAPGLCHLAMSHRTASFKAPSPPRTICPTRIATVAKKNCEPERKSAAKNLRSYFVKSLNTFKKQQLHLPDIAECVTSPTVDRGNSD